MQRAALLQSATVMVAVFCFLLSISSARLLAAEISELQTVRSAPQLYSLALAEIEQQQYRLALVTLRYLQAHHPGFENLSAVQTRIAVLHEAADAGAALVLFLLALDNRDLGKIDQALQILDQLLIDHSDSSLHDDAMYLQAYLQLMHRYDFASAIDTLNTLLTRFPDTAYRDTAVYLKAIAFEQLGNTVLAINTLTELRALHTAMVLPFGYRWSKGNILSRYWFDRTNRRLSMLSKRKAGASVLRSKELAGNGSLRVGVSVDGIDMHLLLTPSTLISKTDWLDAYMQDRLPPAVAVYTGHVEGAAESWVRVVLTDSTISGVVSAYSRQYTLHPGTLIGTLDFYQPRSSRNPAAEHSMGQAGDGLQAPPSIANQGGWQRRMLADQATVRVVPMSIVVDSQYDRYYGGQGMATALNHLNVADGVYRQYGLALSLDEALLFSEGQTDPLVLLPGTLENVLLRFRDYRLQQRTLFSASVVTYLFTGNPRTDSTLGLAWIDTVCRTDGYDVGVTTPSSFGDILLTHELGHSLGAKHDSDTSCSVDASKLMWPHISATTSTDFSQCSRQSVVTTRSKSCLLNAVDLALDVRTVNEGVEFTARNLDAGIGVNATLVIETSEPALLVWPAGCQALTPTSAQCDISYLSAGEAHIITVSFSAAGHSDGIVTGHLLAISEQDITLNNNVATASLGAMTSGNHLPLSIEAATTLNSGPENTSASGAVGVSWLMALLLFYGPRIVPLGCRRSI